MLPALILPQMTLRHGNHKTIGYEIPDVTNLLFQSGNIGAVFIFAVIIIHKFHNLSVELLLRSDQGLDQFYVFKKARQRGLSFDLFAYVLILSRNAQNVYSICSV